MVKVLKIDSRWQNSLNERCIEISSIHDISRIGFQLCNSLQDIFPSGVSFHIKSTLKPRDIFCYGTMQIVSHRIVKILSIFEVSMIEFFPVNVTWNGDEYTESIFFIMNVIDRLKCFDTEKSQYTVDRFIDDDDDTLYISELYKLVIEPVDEHLHKIFYIDDPFGCPSILCVSDSIAQEMRFQNIIGHELIDIDCYKEGFIV
jgi:hypothetical protein